MARWALIQSGTVATVVEQALIPTIPGLWVDCTGEAVGPGSLYSLGAFTPAPATDYRFIRADALWDRFVGSENVDFDIACQHDSSAPKPAQRKAARLRLLRRDIDSLGYARLSGGKIQSLFTTLETDGVLAAGRAAVILNTPINFDEAHT